MIESEKILELWLGGRFMSSPDVSHQRAGVWNEGDGPNHVLAPKAGSGSTRISAEEQNTCLASSQRKCAGTVAEWGCGAGGR